jgi:asparagine synthetase B (glutamine-hydrolysing)
MCGIVGFLDKTHNTHAVVGSVLCDMLRALGCRGPHSAGVAEWQRYHQSVSRWETDNYLGVY